MADQNKSNRGPQNSFVDDIDQSRVLTELERIGQRHGRTTAQREAIRERYEEDVNRLRQLAKAVKADPNIAQTPWYEEQRSGLIQSVSGLRKKMNSIETAASARAESEASTFISRQFNQAAMNGQASTLQREAAVQNRAFGMAGQSWDQLEARKEEIFAGIRASERGTLNEVKGMYGRGGVVDPSKSATVGVAIGRTQESLREVAAINAAQQIQRASGQDPTSKLRNIVEMGQEANRIKSAEGIAQELKENKLTINEKGKAQTIGSGDISSEISRQAKILSSALEELATTTKRTDENLARLRNRAEESAQNLEKLKQAQGMGGGGGLTGGQWAQMAAGGFNAIGGAIQQIGVNQKLGQVNNITGYANIENQKYDMYKAARGGDVASQLLLAQTGKSAEFGRNLYRNQQIANTAYLAGGAAQTAVGGFQVAEGLKDKGTGLIGGSLAGTSGIATNEIVSGATNMMQGASTIAVTGMDMARGVSAGQAGIAGTQADMAARAALLKVGAEQLQGFRNFGVSMGVAAQGMGGRGEAFLQQNISKENLGRMVNARLSPEQMAQMSQMGVQQMGSTFDTNQIYAARGLERSGFGSMQENMQRMSALAAAGSNNPQAGLGSVLEAAVSKGLDSSKSITMLTENTAAMVQSNATAMAAGIDVTGTAATVLAAGIDPMQKNQEFAVQRAMTAQEVAKSMQTDTNVSFSGMMNTARISELTGLGSLDAINAAKLTTEEIRALQGKGDDEIQDALMKKGVDIRGAKGGAQATLQSLLEGKTTQMLNTGIGLSLDDKVRESLGAKAAAGVGWDKLTKDEQNVISKIGMSQSTALTGTEMWSVTAGVQTAKNDPNSAKKVEGLMKDEGSPSETLKALDDMRTSGFKQLSEAALQATANFKSAADALKALGQLSAQYEKGGQKNEKDFSTAAADSAATFGQAGKDFKDAVSRFDSAINKMMDKAGLDRRDDAGQEAMDELSKKGAKRMGFK